MDHDLGRAQVAFPGDATVKGLVWRACCLSDCRYAVLGRLGCMNQRCQSSPNVISPRPEAPRQHRVRWIRQVANTRARLFVLDVNGE